MVLCARSAVSESSRLAFDSPFSARRNQSRGAVPFGVIGDFLDVGILGVAHRRQYQTDSECVVRAGATFSGGWV